MLTPESWEPKKDGRCRRHLPFPSLVDAVSAFLWLLVWCNHRSVDWRTSWLPAFLPRMDDRLARSLRANEEPLDSAKICRFGLARKGSKTFHTKRVIESWEGEIKPTRKRKNSLWPLRAYYFFNCVYCLGFFGCDIDSCCWSNRGALSIHLTDRSSQLLS